MFCSAKGVMLHTCLPTYLRPERSASGRLSCGQEEKSNSLPNIINLLRELQDAIAIALIIPSFTPRH